MNWLAGEREHWPRLRRACFAGIAWMMTRAIRMMDLETAIPLAEVEAVADLVDRATGMPRRAPQAEEVVAARSPWLLRGKETIWVSRAAVRRQTAAVARQRTETQLVQRWPLRLQGRSLRVATSQLRRGWMFVTALICPICWRIRVATPGARRLL